MLAVAGTAMLARGRGRAGTRDGQRGDEGRGIGCARGRSEEQREGERGREAGRCGDDTQREGEAEGRIWLDGSWARVNGDMKRSSGFPS